MVPQLKLNAYVSNNGFNGSKKYLFSQRRQERMLPQLKLNPYVSSNGLNGAKNINFTKRRQERILTNLKKNSCLEKNCNRKSKKPYIIFNYAKA